MGKTSGSVQGSTKFVCELVGYHFFNLNPQIRKSGAKRSRNRSRSESTTEDSSNEKSAKFNMRK